ncbi:hypothetical protein HPB48_009232 [Haemaphysalis longicornis]|uniref:Uncharacterized protein n=1 Tax=Haemaphysalis longicornis TaxID=44386 RepID=A0A9J6FZE2_HAELO|nr:hypothetical protein HPB48_009232 [Haemaphysalis longicornis]
MLGKVQGRFDHLRRSGSPREQFIITEENFDCRPYRPLCQICSLCLKTGHRADVCPMPEKTRCASFFVLNVYSAPKERTDSLNDFQICSKGSKGKANYFRRLYCSPSYMGIIRHKTQGPRLALTIAQQGLTILTDPTQPTRVGKSGESCPDLTLVKDIRRNIILVQIRFNSKCMNVQIQSEIPCGPPRENMLSKSGPYMARPCLSPVHQFSHHPGS